MTSYLVPGVSFEWLDRRPPAVEGLRTDVAGFVGIAERGPLHRPVRVDGWASFLTTFGSHVPQGFLAYAVEGFFANGGRACWVVRAADPTKARAAQLDLQDESGAPAMRLVASSGGTWGDALSVIVARTGARRFVLTLRLLDGTLEVWPNLSTDPLDARFAPTVLADEASGSTLVRAEPLPGLAADLLPVVARLAGGDDGLAALRAAHLVGEVGPPRPWGLDALAAVDEVSVVAVPDLMPKPVVEPTPPPPREPRCEDLTAPPADPWIPPLPVFPPAFGDAMLADAQRALVAHCERLRARVAVIDPPPLLREPRLVRLYRQSFDSSYAALYWPWLRVPDPLRLEGLLRTVPPSGHVAGVYARVDIETGVHKPPANEVVERAPDVDATVDDLAHGELNEVGVNVVRLFPGRGLRIAGARTLSSSPPVRYVNVRRLLLMIAEAIDEQTQWVVFEPSDRRLWRDIDRVVRSFLDDLWRAGKLDGATAEEAYSVACDETTNPPEETALGRMTCLIGVLPPWPAEFVVVRIAKTESGAEILEESGGGRG
jgi:Bacteriophage tail sheath protein